MTPAPKHQQPKDSSKTSTEADEQRLAELEAEAQKIRDAVDAKRRAAAEDLATTVAERLADLSPKLKFATRYIVTFTGFPDRPPIVKTQPIGSARIDAGTGQRGDRAAQYAADKAAGLTTKQIADKHSVTTSTVWSSLHRAK